jgi:hypothetical protein
LLYEEPVIFWKIFLKLASFYRYKFLLLLKEIKKPVPFLGEKKAQQSRKDCAWHISSFIVAKF